MNDPKKCIKPIQFPYNRVPFETYSEALIAVRKKNLLSGEPVEVYYKDSDKNIRKFLAIGDEITHNPLILEGEFNRDETIIIDGNYVDLTRKGSDSDEASSINEDVVND